MLPTFLQPYGTAIIGYIIFFVVIVMHISVYYLIYRIYYQQLNAFRCFRAMTWGEIFFGRVRRMLGLVDQEGEPEEEEGDQAALGLGGAEDDEQASDLDCPLIPEEDEEELEGDSEQYDEEEDFEEYYEENHELEQAMTMEIRRRHV